MSTREHSPSETSTTPRWRWLSLDGRWQVPVLLIAVLSLSFLAAEAGRGYLSGVGLGDSTEEVLAKVCPGPDPCHYLTAGRELLETGSISPPNRWILNLWPPGVVVLSALYILIAKSGIPLPVIAGAVGIGAWTVVLSLWYRYLRPRVGGGIGIAAVLFVALGQPMRHWYLADGLFYMESLSIALLLGSMLSLLYARESVGRTRTRLGIVSGVLLAAAAYLRVVFELVGLTLSVIVIAWLARNGLASMRRRRAEGSVERRRSEVHPLVLCVLIFHVLTIPWRIVASEVVRPGNWLWSTTADLGFAVVWLPTEHLEERGLVWVVHGTGNTACRVAPEECARLFGAEGTSVAELRSKAVRAWLQNPIAWTTIKAEGAIRFWFPDASHPTKFELHENGLLLVMLLVLLLYGYRSLGSGYVLLLALVVATLVPSYVFNYEARFFFPLKSLAPLIGALCLLPLVRKFGLARARARPSGGDMENPPQASSRSWG